tara:strand:- start:616 stop:1059 length:444 start_codon:yes stop_codon:yes gene_type:complete
MLHVMTYVAPSSIHGLGVFTAAPVAKGTLIWTFEEYFDRRYDEAQFQALHPVIHEYFKVYGYRDKHDGFYYMTVDNDRFTNHSQTPNTCVDSLGNCYALKDIACNEELTADYREFYTDLEQLGPFMSNELNNEMMSKINTEVNYAAS